MNSEDLLVLLGQLAREEEDQFEERWDAIARGSLSEQQRWHLERSAWGAQEAALVERLARPLSAEERERLWRRVEAMLRDAPKGPP